MKSSKQTKREAKDLFRASQLNGVVQDALLRSHLDRLVAAKPRGYIDILSHLHRLVKLDLARRSARVESVTVLDAKAQSDIVSTLTAKYGQGLNFSFVQNPSLIGGLRVQVGSDVYDGSVRARLDRLEDTFEIA